MPSAVWCHLSFYSEMEDEGAEIDLATEENFSELKKGIYYFLLGCQQELDKQATYQAAKAIGIMIQEDLQASYGVQARYHLAQPKDVSELKQLYTGEAKLFGLAVGSKVTVRAEGDVLNFTVAHPELGKEYSYLYPPSVAVGAPIQGKKAKKLTKTQYKALRPYIAKGKHLERLFPPKLKELDAGPRDFVRSLVPRLKTAATYDEKQKKYIIKDEEPLQALSKEAKAFWRVYYGL